MSKFKTIISFPKDIWEMLISYLPGKIGYFLRHRYWNKKLKHLGKNVKIDVGVYFQNPQFISIDDNCWIDRNVIILAGLDESKREKHTIKNKEFKGQPGFVHIGKCVHIGSFCIISGISAGVYISGDCTFSAGCKVYAFSHHYRSKINPKNQEFCFGSMVPHDKQCLIEGPVHFGFNVGIALNSVILPGACIPDNCFVAINSVVSAGRHSSNSIISGNPAKKIADRFKLDE